MLISAMAFAQDYPFSLPSDMEATINITSSSKELYNNLLLGTNTHHFSTTTEKDLINKLKPITIRFPHGLWSNWYDWRRDVTRLFGTESFEYEQGVNKTIRTKTVDHLASINTFDNLDIKVGIEGLTGLNATRKSATGKGFDMMWTFNMSADGNDFNNGCPETIARYDDLIARGFDVKAVEMGNENFYPGQRSSIIPNTEDYIARAKAMSAALKSKDPNIKVSIPLLRRDNWANPNWNADLTQDLTYFDAVTVHTYVGSDPDDSTNSDEAYGTALTARKDLGNSIYDYAHQVAPNKPIWLTEWGVKSGGPNAVSALGMADCYIFMSENQDVFERANWFSVNGKLNSHYVWETYISPSGVERPRIKYPLEKTLFGSAYEIIRLAFENTTLIESDMQVPSLVNGVKAVNARVVVKEGKTSVFVVNLSNQDVPFNINIDGVAYTDAAVHKTMSFTSMVEERAIGIDVDPLTLVSQGSGSITLPKFSINIIELTNASLSNSEIAKQAEVSIYPNPSYGTFNIKLNHGEAAQYRIYSMNGVEIQNGKFVSSKEIHFDNNQAGIYILQVVGSQGISTHKIVVQ
ncbi:T9SS type A sorting domain-containing protein [Sabulilitoribacter multivorans]|uniref:T9SS type A sorting domain-containing protein n=1 Tax=Flaviramulus multivorans TaxID=1304750 RepID=A0ABS9ILT3_9FLAO|nr:T9SS type A sorting domain-containing protein [Flaviramulus multivorans]MCF7561547.1 T9SS type A sorting domain-containing protein [Flaviramulus multivorans]